MKIIKRIISLLIILSLAIATTAICSAASLDTNNSKKNKFKIVESLCTETKFADSNKKALEKNFSGKFSESSKMRIELNLESNEDITYNDYVSFKGYGNIIIDNKNIPFNANGSLYPAANKKNEAVFLGVLTGYINNSVEDKNIISLSIHYMPEYDKTFIAACIGIDDGKGNVPVMLDFGTPYSEIKEAYLEKERQDKKDQISYDENQESSVGEEDASISILGYGGTVTDYDPRLKNTGYSSNNIMAVNFYCQNKARFQTLNELSARVTANKANFENFMRTAFGYNIVPNSTDASTVKLEIISAENYFESTDSSTSVVPTAGSTNISFTIPVYIGKFNIGWQTIPISITTSSTSVSFRPATGADPGRKNITTWEFYRFAGFASTDFFTTSSNPEITSGGLAGKSKYYYVMGVNSDKTIYVGATGSAVLTCVDDWTYYVYRSYNISATAATSMIITTN
jgi:hypothetical protein